MADKKLSEVTKVTDMAYVPVILSDGSVGQIAKADLATVVAGMMGNKIFDRIADNGDNFICDMDRGSFIFLFDYDSGKRYGLYFATLSNSNAEVTTIADAMGFSNFFNGFTIEDGKLYLNAKSSTQHVVIWKLTTVI